MLCSCKHVRSSFISSVVFLIFNNLWRYEIWTDGKYELKICRSIIYDHKQFNIANIHTDIYWGYTSNSFVYIVYMVRCRQSFLLLELFCAFQPTNIQKKKKNQSTYQFTSFLWKANTHTHTCSTYNKSTILKPKSLPHISTF